MKKILLVLPIIFLLAAACNNSQKAKVQTPASTQNLEQANSTSAINKPAYCTGSTPTEIGDVVYPVDPKYGKLNRLGQIFTASDCGDQRLKEVTGSKENYDLGVNLVLKSNPSTSLVSVLQTIGFSCVSSAVASTCKEWRLTKTVQIKDLLKLQPFSEFILRDDCINCG